MSCEPAQNSGRDAFVEAARPIIECPNVWVLIVEAMRQRGFAGDARHVEVLYAIFTSRLLKRPMCAFLKAPSSSGKSWLLNRTLELFPPESYEIKSGFSPKAIAYGSADLRHRILAVQEASGLQGREGNMLVRTLISEGLIRWEVAGRDADGFTTRTVTRPGPIAFVLTTTHETLHKEDETRALSIEVEDTTEHTREVMRNIGRNFARTARPDAVDLAPWHAFQRWLEGGPRDVLIPFAEAIGALMFVRTNRAKRDFEQLLSAVAASALLHQQRRERDADGRVVAAIEDYAHAARFLYKPLNEACGSAAPRGVREVVERLLDHQRRPVNPNWTRDLPRGFSIEELAREMRVDRSVASRRVSQAKELGLVVDLGHGKQRPARLMVVEPLPEDWDMLPRPDYVAAEARGELTAYLRRQREAEPAEDPEPLPGLRTAREEHARRKAARERGEDPDADDIFGPRIDDWPDDDGEAATPADADPAPIEAPAAAQMTESSPTAPTAHDAPLRHPRLMPPIIANAPKPRPRGRRLSLTASDQRVQVGGRVVAGRGKYTRVSGIHSPQ